VPVTPPTALHQRDLTMEDFPLSLAYRLLEPGPVVLLTTAHNGRANVMTMSWHMMVDSMLPLVACVVSRGDFSFGALRATRECVIAVPTAELAAKVVEIGNCSGRDVDKFATIGLTPRPALEVVAPLIAECFANLECRVVDMRLTNKYNLFVLEVVKAWIEPGHKKPRTIHHRGYGEFFVDGETIKLPSRMPWSPARSTECGDDHP
jgi:flavin reductase (DIM6/NTAB) family NADH-FMN oxidoreductase RutF